MRRSGTGMGSLVRRHNFQSARCKRRALGDPATTSRGSPALPPGLPPSLPPCILRLLPVPHTCCHTHDPTPHMPDAIPHVPAAQATAASQQWSEASITELRRSLNGWPGWKSRPPTAQRAGRHKRMQRLQRTQRPQMMAALRLSRRPQMTARQKRQPQMAALPRCCSRLKASRLPTAWQVLHRSQLRSRP